MLLQTTKARNWLPVLILSIAFTPGLLTAADSTQPVIPAGTRVDIQLTSPVSTSANQQGDPFTAEVEDPIFSGGHEVIPAGSTLRGHVTLVKPPGRAKGKAEMRLVADTIVTKSGKQFSFNAQLASNDSSNGTKVKGDEGTVEGPGKSKKKGAEDAGIGAAAGAGIGAIAAGGDGALYGAGIGAAVGLIHMLAKHHKDIVLHPGTELTFVLSTPATETKASKLNPVSTPFVCTTCQ
ncbi:MAG TPA: hypothetical protein VFZ08_02655 [Terriglobia bacterium]|nr:hypothetical protein [Terriglobia bacterium]